MTCTPEHAAEQRRLRVYGLPPGSWATILELQGGRCAVCAREFGPELPAVVDHQHGRGGRVRGALCRRCNHKVVGQHTDPAPLEAAAAYLRNPPAYALGLGPVPARKPSRRARRRAA